MNTHNNTNNNNMNTNNYSFPSYLNVSTMNAQSFIAEYEKYGYTFEQKSVSLEFLEKNGCLMPLLEDFLYEMSYYLDCGIEEIPYSFLESVARSAIAELATKGKIYIGCPKDNDSPFEYVATMDSAEPSVYAWLQKVAKRCQEYHEKVYQEYLDTIEANRQFLRDCLGKS